MKGNFGGKTMRKVITIFLFGIISSILLVACNNQSSNEASNESGAEDYPNKPIKIVVPFSPGGSASNTARIAAQYAEEELGQEIVIENREGGGGAVGTALVSTEDPDGYTLLLATPSLVSSAVFSDVSFTPDSFEPVVQLVYEPTYLVGANEEPFNNIETFIEYAKENPGKVRISNSGAQGSKAIAADQWIEHEGLEIENIPYDGGSEAAAAAAGGHVEAQIGNYSETAGQVDAGKLEPILVFSQKDSENYPGLTTSFDIGYEVEAGTWRGFLAPKGTDAKIIKILEDTFEKVFENKEFLKQMEESSIPVEFRSSEEFKERIYDEYEMLKRSLE